MSRRLENKKFDKLCPWQLSPGRPQGIPCREGLINSGYVSLSISIYIAYWVDLLCNWRHVTFCDVISPLEIFTVEWEFDWNLFNGMYMSVLTSFVALHEGISNFMLIYFIEKNSSISVFPIRLDFPYEDNNSYAQCFKHCLLCHFCMFVLVCSDIIMYTCKLLID